MRSQQAERKCLSLVFQNLTKLSPQRANDLVFVFTKLRLMARCTQPEKFAEWVKAIDEEQQLALLGSADNEELVRAFEMNVDSDAIAAVDESAASDDE